MSKSTSKKAFKYREIKAMHLVSLVLTIMVIVMITIASINSTRYEGIYRSSFIYAAFATQLPLLLTKKIDTQKRYKRIISTLILVIMMPVFFMLTKPYMTYQEGIKKVSQACDFEFKYVDRALDNGYSRIPAINKPGSIFISNYLYYYKVKTDDVEIYYVVDPITGKVDRLEKKFLARKLKNNLTRKV